MITKTEILSIIRKQIQDEESNSDLDDRARITLERLKRSINKAILNLNLND